MEKQTVKSIIACATISTKKENEDNLSQLNGHTINFMAIADGVGSYTYPTEASRMVCEFLLSKAKDIDKSQTAPAGIDFNGLFRLSKENVVSHAARKYKHTDSGKDLLGTTVISLFELDEAISFGYLGNGAIWHIRGNLNDFPDTMLYPWNITNYLNPHSISENGKEAIYKLISESPDYEECVPTTLSIIKDKSIGDIVIICTDGIYSSDQTKIGANEKGIWQKLDHAILTLIKYLRQYLSGKTFTNKTLAEMLNKYLNEIRPLLDDDATIGMLMTKEAINYQIEHEARK